MTYNVSLLFYSCKNSVFDYILSNFHLLKSKIFHHNLLNLIKVKEI